MKILLDFLPILVFFIVYKWTGDLILATAVLIPATLLQIAYTWITRKVIEKMQLTTLILVIILGSATVLLDDGKFIMWKPTVVNWLFGLAFLLSQFIGAKPIIQRMLEDKITLPDTIWRRLNLTWAGFFTVMGLVNLYVAFNFSEDTWVNFKLFGMLGLTLVFILLQGFYISRYIQSAGNSAPEE
jgi:intracellular septation protein